MIGYGHGSLTTSPLVGRTAFEVARFALAVAGATFLTYVAVITVLAVSGHFVGSRRGSDPELVRDRSRR